MIISDCTTAVFVVLSRMYVCMSGFFSVLNVSIPVFVTTNIVIIVYVYIVCF